MAASAQPTRFRDASAESLGARVFSCDFQVHAPPDWRGEVGEKSTDDFIADDYLPQVFASGRHVIGVPQHDAIGNPGGAKRVRDIARRLRAEGRHDIPVVFPGYELTSTDQLQVILLANPDEEDVGDLDTRVHESLRLGLAGRQWHQSALDLQDLLREVHDRFRDRLVILLVATGHKGVLEDGNAVTRNREVYHKALGLVDGMILAGRFADCHDKTKRLLLGQLTGYKSSRAAYLQSSDAHTFDELANAKLSHVKLGSFSVEGLRQALLNCATFVGDSTFPEPTLVIERLCVRHTVFFDAIDIQFSRHLTTLVGGRGTGKSCLLEYISHVCDYQRSTQYDRPNMKILVLRKEGNTEGTILPSTKIELHVRVGEKHYRFERMAAESTAIYECAEDSYEGGIRVDGASPADLINLRLFGQRELANIVRNPSFFTLDPSQREGINLFSFLKSDQLSQVGECERQASRLIDDIKKLSIDLASSARELVERPKLVSERERLSQDLKKIKKQAAAPAFQSHRDFLQLAANRDSVFESLEEIHRAQDDLASASAKILAKIERAFTSTATGAEESLQSLKEAAVLQTKEFLETLNGVRQSWTKATHGLRASTENQLVTEAGEQHAEEYDAAKREMEEQDVNLTLLEPLQKRIMAIDTRLSTFAERDEGINEARTKRRVLVKQLRDARKNQADIYVALARQLTASTKQRVRMTVVRAGNFEGAISEFQGRLRDKRRFRRDDADELVAALRREITDGGGDTDPAELWTQLVDNLLEHYEAIQDESLGRTRSGSAPDDLSWVGTVGGKLKDVVVTLDDEEIAALLCEYVADSANIELRRRADADDYIPISHASVGQKATALFLILLAQTDGLLVIDQPEDDLDNAFIATDILPALQELKHEQQIIFATHNANMLVNAESEKIVVLDTEPRSPSDPSLPTVRGHVEYEGGIDQTKLRERITIILEGGRDAFLSRERKYRFTNDE